MVHNKYVQIAILIVIEIQEAPSHARVGHAGGVRVVSEHAAIVLIEMRLIGIRRVPTVSDKKIEIAVIVMIEERSSPGPTGIASAGKVRLVRKGPVAIVAKQAVAAMWRESAGQVDQCGDEPVESAIAVVVADRATHAVFVRADSSGDGSVGKCAVAIVPEYLARQEVGGYGKIWVAIAVEVAERRRVAIRIGIGASALGVRGPKDVEAGRTSHILKIARVGGPQITQQA